MDALALDPAIPIPTQCPSPSPSPTLSIDAYAVVQHLSISALALLFRTLFAPPPANNIVLTE